MIAISIVVSFIAVLYFREIFMGLIKPALSRGNRELKLQKLLSNPLIELVHKIRTTNLDLKRDLFSLLKISILHLTLVGISAISSQNVSSFSHIFIVLYIVFLIIELYQYQFIFKNERYSSKNLIVAVVMLACVASCLSLVIKLSGTGLSTLNGVLISLYCLVILFFGIFIRDSLIPNTNNYNLYQQVEIEFARFTWLATFIALFDPSDLARFSFGSIFMFKILALEMGYKLASHFIPKLSTEIRWQIVFKYVIPITLVSVFGVFVSVAYVK